MTFKDFSDTFKKKRIQSEYSGMCIAAVMGGRGSRKRGVRTENVQSQAGHVLAGRQPRNYLGKHCSQGTFEPVRALDS